MSRACTSTLLAAALLAVACQPKNNGTLLVVLVDSNLPAGQLDRIEVEVRPTRGKTATQSFVLGPQAQPPFRLALVPEGDPVLEMDLIARAMLGTRAAVTLAATVSFEPGVARETTLLLSRDCVEGKAPACSGAQQCVEGGVCLPKKQVAVLRPLGTAPKDAGAPPVDLGGPVVDTAPDRTPPPREAGVINGTWTTVVGPAFTGTLSGVAPVSDKEVWVVGTGGPYGAAFQYDGTAWAAVQLPMTSPLSGIWAAAPGDLWVVGYNGTILHKLGDQPFMPVPSGVAANLNAVSGTGAKDVWFAGAMRTVLHWDGSAITADGEGIVTELNAVAAASAGDVWVAGNAGGVYRRMGKRWVRQAEGMTTAVLYGIWAGNANDVWAVGDGVALHFDGATWASSTLAPAVVGHAVWGAASNDVWAVGRVPGGFVAHFDGNVWSPITVPNVGALMAVRGLNANDVWAVGKAGILHLR